MNISTWKQAQSIVGTSPGRPENDFYPTPAYVTQALLDREKFNGMIWECACGDGSMSDVLIDNGYEVFSTDIVDRGYKNQNEIADFLVVAYPQFKRIPNIITNPPFKLSEKFVDNAINYWKCDKLALLCKLIFLEGQTRSRLLEKTPLKFVHVFRKRIKLTRNGEPIKGGGMIAFAWFVWERGYKDYPRIDWI